MQDSSQETGWDGPGWRWKALGTGIGVVALTALLAQLASFALGEPASVFLTIGLLIELFVLSFMGSGMLEGTSRRMSRGGLQRETATIDIDYKPAPQHEADKQRDRDSADRRTIRVGIMALPVFITFVYMLLR